MATGAATVLTLSRSLNDELDRRVVQTLAMLPDRSRDTRRPGSVDWGEDDAGRPGPFGDGLLVQAAGPIVTRNFVTTLDRRQVTLTGDQLAHIMAAGLSERPISLDLGDQIGHYRVAARTAEFGRLTISGLPEHQTEQTVARLSLLSTIFGLLGLALMGISSWWLVGANLRPLRRVADTATRVSHLPLSQGDVTVAERVPISNTDSRTEVGQVGAALNQLLDHVDASLQARHRSETQLRQFVADASHELRTPLASIRGYAELSRREQAPVPPSITHALGRIDAESLRMTALVEDLLLLARLDAGRPLASQPVDLTMLTIDAVADMRVTGPEHRWRLDLPEEAVEAVGDTQRLTQVVVNLLHNARVHTPPGTTVTARLRAQGPHAVLEVEDDGPGIDPELLPRVFSRFTRGDEARNRAQGSTGLGLSIVDAVVAAHGGTVRVASRPGQTVFTLRLPTGH
ncbi:MAG: HAMP domain-containing histidine kinase [Austwickia sp.]|nr:HAMP domain-containing histidine kinase [Austwickia sp.]MBK8437705.1 HAMP domain-containing histidine kinase [Austwickia sp.]MBK9100016.1 HAMP domain-containing histidine kinase [Austwickia sp.]